MAKSLADRRILVSVLCTWPAFVIAILLALPQPPAPARVALGAILGIPVIVLGFWAGARYRSFVPNPPNQRLRRAVYSLLLGAALGGVLLIALMSLARWEPLLSARFAARAGEPSWRPWALAFESSIIEEIVFRLFILSLAAWALSRFFAGRALTFNLAWVFSSLLFGLAHLPQWLALTGPSAFVFAAVLALNGIGGLLFGWIFWRWGLPYAILCHAAGDVIVQSLAPRLL